MCLPETGGGNCFCGTFSAFCRVRESGRKFVGGLSVGDCGCLCVYGRDMHGNDGPLSALLCVAGNPHGFGYPGSALGGNPFLRNLPVALAAAGDLVGDRSACGGMDCFAGGGGTFFCLCGAELSFCGESDAPPGYFPRALDLV